LFKHFFTVLLFLCVSSWSFEKSKVEKETGLLDLKSEPSYSAEVISYFACYSLDFADSIKHFFGYVQADSFRIATHVFLTPENSRTVLMTHGYLDHVGILKNVIKECLNAGYSVVAFDLPGHGLSSGDPASIGSFTEYARVYDSVRKSVSPVTTAPLTLVAHSTGCAAALEYLAEKGGIDIKEIILLAPLIKTAYFGFLKAGQAIISPFTKRTVRLYRNQSSDKEFLNFLRNDTLRIESCPLRWASAYFSWFDKTQSLQPRSTPPVTVIQGSRDDVVDWRYNVPFLKEKFTDIKVYMIKGAKHQLMNEAGNYKTEFEKTIRDCLYK